MRRLSTIGFSQVREDTKTRKVCGKKERIGEFLFIDLYKRKTMLEEEPKEEKGDGRGGGGGLMPHTLNVQ